MSPVMLFKSDCCRTLQHFLSLSECSPAVRLHCSSTHSSSPSRCSSCQAAEAEAGERQVGHAVCVHGDLHVAKKNLASVADPVEFPPQLREPLQDPLVFTTSQQPSEVQDSNQVFPAAGGGEENRKG